MTRMLTKVADVVVTYPANNNAEANTCWPEAKEMRQHNLGTIPPVVTAGQDTDAAILQHVWRQMNHVDGTELVARLNTRSMMVGDVVTITRLAKYYGKQDSRLAVHYLCNNVGWVVLTDENLQRWVKVNCRDRGMGLEWCQKQGLMPRE